MSHWYDDKGELFQYVPNASKPGQLRPVTLRDARKNHWFPSTTTKLGILNKFLLNEYIKKEVIKLAIMECSKIGRFPEQILPSDFSDDLGLGYSLFHDIMRKSEENVSWAANFGTRTHKLISSLYGGEPYEEPELDELDLVIAENVVAISRDVMSEFGDFTKVKAVGEATKAWMDANGFECLETEFTMVVPELGIAGTADFVGLHYGKPCVADFKTEDAEDTSKFYFWEEFQLQLADYAMALNYFKWFGPRYELEDIERISILTSRTNPGVVFARQWSEESDFRKMNMITEYYFLDKKYDPRISGSMIKQEELF